MNTKLEQVRAKVIEAVPELIEANEGCNNSTCFCKLPRRPITLADVLRTIEKLDPGSYFLDVQGGWWQWNKAGVDPEFLGMKNVWNLSLPLDEQEPEVVGFLYQILCEGNKG